MTLAPPPDHELVLLETIRLTAERARATQLVIRHCAGSESVPVAVEVDRGIDRVRHDQLDSIYVGSDELDLPSPSVTNTNLHHYLTVAGRAEPRFEAGGSRRWRSRFRAKFRRRRQDEFNAAVLHALHQLDHRTRVQDHVIVQLEARLAEARRRAENETQAIRP